MRKQLEDVQLSNESVKFAGNYVADHFKNGNTVEKHLVINTIAHGYYMGARHAQKTFEEKRWWHSFFRRRRSPYSEKQLTEEGIKAAHFYVRKKGYQRLSSVETSLVRATLSLGFKEGFRSVEKSVTFDH